MKFECSVEIREGLFDYEKSAVVVEWSTKTKEEKIYYRPMFFKSLPPNPEIPKKVNVFHLGFYGEPFMEDREAWADPLRALILQRLAPHGYVWHLGLEGYSFNDFGQFQFFDEQLTSGYLKEHNLPSVILPDTQMRDWSRQTGWVKLDKYFNRIFFEVSNNLLPEVINKFWYRIEQHQEEGYCMASGKTNKFQEWGNRLEDKNLPKELFNETLLMFITTDSRTRDFVFITDKFSFDEFSRMIDIDDLNQKAMKISQDNNQAIESGEDYKKFTSTN